MTKKGLMCTVCGDIRSSDMCCVMHIMESDDVRESRRKRIIASEIFLAMGGKGLRMVYYNRWLRFARESKNSAQLKRFRNEVYIRRAQRLELELERAILIADLQDAKSESTKVIETNETLIIKNDSLVKSLQEASAIVTRLQSELESQSASVKQLQTQQLATTSRNATSIARRVLSIIISNSDKEVSCRYFNTLRRFAFQQTLRKQLTDHYNSRLVHKDSQLQFLSQDTTDAKKAASMAQKEVHLARDRLNDKQRECNSLQRTMSSSKQQLETLKKELSNTVKEQQRLTSQRKLLSSTYLSGVSLALLRRTSSAIRQRAYTKLRTHTRESLLTRVKDLCKSQNARLRALDINSNNNSSKMRFGGEPLAARRPSLVAFSSLPRSAPITPLSVSGSGLSSFSTLRKPSLGIRTFTIPQQSCQSYDSLQDQITVGESMAEVEL